LTCFGVKNAEQEHVSTLKGLTTMLDCEQRQIVLVVNFVQRLVECVPSEQLAAFPDLSSPKRYRRS